MKPEILDMLISCIRERAELYPENSDTRRELQNAASLLAAKCFRAEV